MRSSIYFFFFLNSRKPHLPKSALCEPRWVSKTPAVPGSYKRCTPWLELETCYADLKLFAITLRPLGTLYPLSTTNNIIHVPILFTLGESKKIEKPIKPRNPEKK
jgi:hypothetical protein